MRAPAMKFPKPDRLLPGLAAVVLGVGAITAWLIPPALFNDFAAGWQVWLSMKAGTAFNTVAMPMAADLSRDQEVFQSWWSPGQYLLPAIFTEAGLSMGRAVVLCGVLANLTGLAGWWRLWREWGVAPGLVTASGVVVVLGRAFGAVLGMSNLADSLLFAAVPWAGLLVWRWRRLALVHCAALFVIFNVGVTLKLAFQAAALAMLAGAVLSAARDKGGGRALIGLAVRALAVWVAVKFAWDWFYLARGASIGPVHAPEFAGLGATLLPWGGPLLSAFSAGNFLGRIFLYPGGRLLADESELWPFFLVAAVLTAWVVARLWRMAELRTYATQVAAWLGVYGAVFILLYATGAAVSLEERHFHAAGLVLLPGILAVIARMTSRAGRWVAIGVVGGFCVYGVASVFVHAAYRSRVGVPSRHGFLHTDLTAGALAELRRWDELPGERTLFFTTKPEISLEVRRGRTMCIPLDSWTEPFVRQITFEGRVSRLVLVMPVHQVRAGRVEWIKAGLHGYTEWDVTEVDGFVFFAGR